MASAPPPQDSKVDPGLASSISEVIGRGRDFLARQDAPPGLVKMWLGQMRMQIRKAYGPDSQAERWWPAAPETLTRDQARDLLQKRLLKAEKLLQEITDAPRRALAGPLGHRIFIGHGRSPLWRELKDFLQERLGLPWEEFNRESVSGIATTERIEHMLNVSTFAFLIMTSEDEHSDQTRHARANVIHEVGLFQGHLGMRRAIILLEDGCQQFSNVHGLTHISFPPGRISAAFEDIRRVLEREGLTET